MAAVAAVTPDVPCTACDGDQCGRPTTASHVRWTLQQPPRGSRIGSEGPPARPVQVPTRRRAQVRAATAPPLGTFVVTVPRGTTKLQIAMYAFEDCKQTKIMLPPALPNVGRCAFQG